MDDFETNFGSEENETDDSSEVSLGQHGQFIFICFNDHKIRGQNIFNRGKKPRKILI